MNINENIRNKRKMVEHLKECTYYRTHIADVYFLGFKTGTKLKLSHSTLSQSDKKSIYIFVNIGEKIKKKEIL